MRRADEDRENFFTYLNYDERDIAWQLYVTTLGRVRIYPGQSYPYRADSHPEAYTLNWGTGRILNEFQILYIAEGSGRFRSSAGERSLLPGTIAVLRPGERHWYRPDPDIGWKEYWIGFKGECADLWLERGFISEREPICRAGSPETVGEIFESAVHIAQEGAPGAQRLIASLVPRLVALLDSDVNCSCNENIDLITHAKAVFEEHLFTVFDVEGITSRLNVGYQTLRDRFNQQTGMSPYQYFLQMKIAKAKDLLLHGDLSVKEVSIKLAFDNPYYFSRLFKKKTGISPSRWGGKAIKADLYMWDDGAERL